MTLIYNSEPARIDLEATQGDSIDMNFQVTAEYLSNANRKIYVEAITIPELGIPLFLVGLDMWVRRKDSIVVKEWSSMGVTPHISINPVLDGEFQLTDTDGFLDHGFYDYDCQVHDPGVGGQTYTIMTGTFHVKKQITP